MTLQVGFKKLTDTAIMPTREHDTDSGYDLYADEDVIITPNETKVIKTGISVKLPPNCEAQVRPRSGITSRTKLRVQLGTIDNGYNGDVGVIVDNTAMLPVTKSTGVRYLDGSPSTVGGDNNFAEGTYRIKKGDKIAQLVVQYLPKTVSYEVKNDWESERGSNGFGSTGV